MASKQELDDERLRHRFMEMRNRAEAQCRWIYSDFLSPAEQSILLGLGYRAEPFLLVGGFDGSERKLACFGSEDLCYSPAEPPISCIRISPKNARFSGRMGHRDILGSLMGLGIKRETLGDILIHNGTAWVLCLTGIADYILSQLETVGRTTVVTEIDAVPSFAVEEPEPVVLVAASDRVDALLAAVYKLSRTEASELIRQGLVFVNSRQTLDPSCKVGPGAVVNLRGKGRFLYHGPEGLTHSGRLRASVGIYP